MPVWCSCTEFYGILTVTVIVAPFESLTTTVPAGDCDGPAVAEMVSTLPDIDAAMRPGVTEDNDEIA